MYGTVPEQFFDESLESILNNVDNFFEYLKLRFKIFERCNGNLETINGFSISKVVVILHNAMIRIDNMK